MRFALLILVASLSMGWGKQIISGPAPVLLRSGTNSEWAEFDKFMPAARPYALEFTNSLDSPAYLLIEHRDVKHEWEVRLNGKRLGKLHQNEEHLTTTFQFGDLKEGANILQVSPPKQPDDILIIKVTLLAADYAHGNLKIQVTETNNGQLLPSRISIATENGVLPWVITAKPDERGLVVQGTNFLAVRPGVIYSSSGQAEFKLLEGTYYVYGSRGFEYSVATQKIVVAKGGLYSLNLPITREVNTKGLLSCDTHLHTLSLSRHGDATLHERILTLAGEGLDIGVSTEHNRTSDYIPAAQELGMENYLTLIPGVEVTTEKGHFNAFPLPIDSRVPDFRITHWDALLKNIRETPGVQVVILNHPADTHAKFTPVSRTNFNLLTGSSLPQHQFNVNGMEVINSGALRSDLMETFRGWFALLNAGHVISGVGSSDSHDVARYIPGQGRTYIPAKGAGDIYQAFKTGSTFPTMGLLPIFTHTNLTDTHIEFKIETRSPSWIKADRVELFENGKLISFANSGSAGLRVRKPRFDTWYVAVATGPGVRAPFWQVTKPYQPSSKEWTPRVIGATAPLGFDLDNDNKFSFPADYARNIVQQNSNSSRLIQELNAHSDAVIVQAAAILKREGKELPGATGRIGQLFKAVASSEK